MKTIATISLLIAIAAAAFSYYLFENFQTNLQSLHSHGNQLKQLEESSNLKINFLYNEINNLKNELINEQKKQSAQTQNIHWALADIDYMIQVADIRLQTLKDINGATALLNTALEKLQKLNNPNWFNLQEAVKKDLTTLQNTTPQNTTDLWLKITDVMQQINQLPLKAQYDYSQQQNQNAAAQKEAAQNTTAQNTTPQNTAPKEQPTSAEKQSWEEALNKSWEHIKDLVKIRHHDKTIEPLLSEKEQLLIKENLRLMLEQIRFAILSGEESLYQKTIQESEQWLAQYFDGNNEKFKKIQSTLEDLAKIHLQTEVPALTSLEQLNTAKHQNQNQNQNQNPSQNQ